MSDYALVLLRQMQDRLAFDIQRAATFEERTRLTSYWYDLQRAIDGEAAGE